MAATKAFRVTGEGDNPGLYVSADTVDRHVHIRGTANSIQEFGFTYNDLLVSGFPVTPEGVEFTLQAGDQIWLKGVNQPGTYVYFLITKEA
jgi:hypothetical protein